MKIELTSIYDSEKGDISQLEKIDHELTEKDYEYYDLHGWKRFRQEDFVQTLLPSLGEPIYSEKMPLVGTIKGKRYLIEFNSDYNYDPWDVNGKTLELTETEEPLSQSIGRKAYYQLFGQPRWVQGSYYPFYQGKPCCHLLTVENGWGDSGNYNILLGFDEKDNPSIAYFEASCC